MRSLSAIFPAYNEAQNIERTVEAARAILPRVATTWEIIVVNDGSRDDTGRICDELAGRYSEVRPVHHPQNQGYGAAVKSGILASRMERIFFSDADGQFDLKELPLLLEHADEYEIVAGYRGKRSDPVHRLVNAWGWNVLVRLLLGIRVRDIDCAFKVFQRRVFEKVNITSVGAMVNTEILAQAKHFGFRTKQVCVSHFPREHGRPTGANLRVITKAFRELFRLWGRLRRIGPDHRGLFAPGQKSAFQPAAKSDG